LRRKVKPDDDTKLIAAAAWSARTIHRATAFSLHHSLHRKMDGSDEIDGAHSPEASQYPGHVTGLGGGFRHRRGWGFGL